jgi:hypothetical protein
VSVGLGNADQTMQMQGAQMILNEQKALMPAGIVKPENLFNAAAKLAQAVGEKNPEKYFSMPDQQGPPPDPMQNPEFMLKVKESQQKDRELDIKKQTADQQGQLVAAQVLTAQVANLKDHAALELEVANHNQEQLQQAQDAANQDEQQAAQAKKEEAGQQTLQALVKSHAEAMQAHQTAMDAMGKSHELIMQALSKKPTGKILVVKTADGYVGTRQ